MLTLLKAKFTGWLQHPVVLEIDGRRHTFRSSTELESVLHSRTDVSADVLKGLSRHSEHELRQEYRDVSAVHRRLMNHMLRVMEDNSGYASIWEDLDISSLPEDHHWQSLLFTLGDEQHVGDDFRRVAVVNYIRYLTARREVIEDLFREFRRAGRIPGTQDTAGWDALSGSDPTKIRGYIRLVRDVPVRIKLPENAETTVYLGRYRVQLRLADEVLHITDTNELTVELPPGRHLLGRSQECSVVITGNSREIAEMSRRHLSVELDSDGEVRVTDQSSRGTFVPRNILASDFSSYPRDNATTH